MNSILEPSDSDDEVAAGLRHDYDRRIAVLSGTVEDARQRGEVGADVDPGVRAPHRDDRERYADREERRLARDRRVAEIALRAL